MFKIPYIWGGYFYMDFRIWILQNLLILESSKLEKMSLWMKFEFVFHLENLGEEAERN